MAWRDQIRPASFRGVPFGVTSDDTEGGRRTVVHEFPQREEACVEDLGAATRRFTLQAFVLGADYMDRRDELERALSEPGPGTLVHPWYGEITVNQFAPYKVKHTAADGGMAVFTLSFARDMEPSGPSGVVNQQLRALEKASIAGALSCDIFDAAFSIAGQPALVAEGAFGAVMDGLSGVQSALGGDLSQVSGLLGAASGYDFLAWESPGNQLWGVMQGMGDAALNAGKSAAGLAGDWLSAAETGMVSAGDALMGGVRSTIAANNTAVAAFTRRIAVVEASRALAVCVPESRQLAQTLRYAYTDALDGILDGGLL